MDSALKSLLVGRWGAIVLTLSSVASLVLGVTLTPDEQKVMVDAGETVINSGFIIYSAITGLIAMVQATWSRIKTR